jgi:hypothetical protein
MPCQLTTQLPPFGVRVQTAHRVEGGFAFTTHAAPTDKGGGGQLARKAGKVSHYSERHPDVTPDGPTRTQQTNIVTPRRLSKQPFRQDWTIIIILIVIMIIVTIILIIVI